MAVFEDSTIIFTRHNAVRHKASPFAIVVVFVAFNIKVVRNL